MGMNGYDAIAFAAFAWMVVQLTRLGLNYRTARRRDLAKQVSQP